MKLFSSVFMGLLALVIIVVVLAAIYGPIIAFCIWGWKACIGAIALSVALTGTASLINLTRREQ